ncbi:hypothetical protein D7V86_26655 [bacterium D16-51]|nr:hypothetical protein D7V96_07580 [bacterium D16-59]RKI51285.1 hypothetical protein D7V86_26655 [bacterium D16-51]
MTNCYFSLALTEEKAGNEPAALLLYLSSFCDSFNSGNTRPYGTVAKIRMLQSRLSIPDQQLYDMMHSYGPLSDAECRKLLSDSIDGNISGINATLAVCEC